MCPKHVFFSFNLTGTENGPENAMSFKLEPPKNYRLCENFEKVYIKYTKLQVVGLSIVSGLVSPESLHLPVQFKLTYLL